MGDRNLPVHEEVKVARGFTAQADGFVGFVFLDEAHVLSNDVQLWHGKDLHHRQLVQDGDCFLYIASHRWYHKRGERRWCDVRETALLAGVCGMRTAGDFVLNAAPETGS